MASPLTLRQEPRPTPAVTPRAPPSRIGRSGPLRPAYFDSVIHPPRRRGLVVSRRENNRTDRQRRARLQSRQGEDGATQRRRGLQHHVGHRFIQGEQRPTVRSEFTRSPYDTAPVQPGLRG